MLCFLLLVKWSFGVQSLNFVAFQCAQTSQPHSVTWLCRWFFAISIPLDSFCLFVFSKFCLDWNLQLASFCFLVLSLPQCLHTTIWKNTQRIFKNTNLFWSLQNHKFTHKKKIYMHPDEHWQVESMVQLRHRTKLLFQGRLNEALHWCSHFR